MARKAGMIILSKRGSASLFETQAPSSPGSFSVAVISANEIDLSWTASTPFSAGSISYKIYRDTSPSPTVLIKTTSSLSYHDTGLLPSTHYYYAIEAVETIGSGSFVSDQALDDDSTLAGLLFSADFNNASIVPTFQLGSAGSVVRAGQKVYNSSISTLATAANDTLAGPWFPFGGSSSITHGAAYISHGLKNWCLQSQAGGTSPWALVNGAETVTDNSSDVTDPFGNNNATKIVTTGATQGITQTTNYTATGMAIENSFYVRTASSTKSVKIRMKTTTGYSDFIDFTATTTWQRFSIYGQPGSGSVIIQIETNAAGTIYVFGMQLEDKSASSQAAGFINTPSDYVPTTTVEVTSVGDRFTYPADNFTAALATKGSFSTWVCHQFNENDIVSNRSRVYFSFGTLTTKLLAETEVNALGARLFYDDVAVAATGAQAFTKNQYVFLVYTWDNSSAPGAFKIYIDGALAVSNTSTRTTPTLSGALNVFDFSPTHTVGDSYAGMGQFEFYTDVLDATTISNRYNAEKAAYGR